MGGVDAAGTGHWALGTGQPAGDPDGHDVGATAFGHPRIVAVVPCYHVAAHIGEVVGSLNGRLAGAIRNGAAHRRPDGADGSALVDAIVIVDDGSDDGLSDVLATLVRESAIPIDVVTHPSNRGLAVAMASGFTRALSLGADIVVKVDGDGQMDPAEIPRLVQPIVAGRADFTKGNRLRHRRHLRPMPLVRLWGNLALSFLAKLATGYWNIVDPTNGYLALRRELVEALDLARLGPGYFFETSLLCEAYLAGAVVRDVPMTARYEGEASSLSIGRVILTFPGLMLRKFVRRVGLRYFLWDFNAASAFLLAGGTLTAWGLVFGGYHWWRNAGSGIPTPTGTIMLSVLPVIVGIQLLVQAVVMDVGNVPAESPWNDSEARRRGGR